MSDARLEELKRKRDQLNAQIQQKEARLRAEQRTADNKVKVLLGATVAQMVRANRMQLVDLLGVLDEYLERDGDRRAVLGEDGQGSEALHRVLTEGRLRREG